MVKEWIEQMTPVGTLKGAFDYLHRLQGSAKE